MGKKGLPMVGARIRTLREAHGWTQAQLAARVQMTPSYISILERGHVKRPSAGALRRLATALDISLTDLLDESRSLDGALLARRPPAPGEPDVDWAHLAQVWPRIRPALRPYMVELASILATMSMVLDSAADPNQGRPTTQPDLRRQHKTRAGRADMALDDAAWAWEPITTIQITGGGALWRVEVALALYEREYYLRVRTSKAGAPNPARVRILEPYPAVMRALAAGQESIRVALAALQPVCPAAGVDGPGN
jgi:transcriptional regulator with XRE-family HTH domain